MSRRDYKEFATGEYYHVFNRGNNRMDIFRDRSDYTLFLDRLKENLYPIEAVKGHLSQRDQRKRLEPDLFSLVAYCLMPNHFHFLMQQKADVPISKLMLKLLGSYSKYFNKKYGRVGSLFQDQFRSTHVVSNTQLVHVSAYIHLNPKIAELVNDAAFYPYSSYSEYIDARSQGICEKSMILDQFKNRESYRKYVEASTEDIKTRKEIDI